MQIHEQLLTPKKTAAKTELETEARQVLLANRLVTNGHQYTVPSPTTYPYQWLWDSCFHAIVLAHFDIAAAKEELRSLVSVQFENGMIPHMIYWNPGTLYPFRWGKNGTSSITQPPMLAYAILAIYKRDQDYDFLQAMYPALYRFYTYLVTVRDPRSNHLVGIINPDESGEDNSPRFDQLLGLEHKHELEENLRRRLLLVEQIRSAGPAEGVYMKKYFWAKDVPFNVITIENIRCLAQIAEVLGKLDDVGFWKTQAGLMEQAMREKMFEDGVFWSTQGENYDKIRIKTWAIFAPLFAGLYTDDEAKRLVEKYFWDKREFNTPYMLPTVALSEPSYDPVGFWRGPVWVGVNWFVYKGLVRYGMSKEAEHIKNSSESLLQRSNFREYFCPDTGEGLGAEQFTWGALVLDME